jgi:hypothetical protein
MLSIADIWMRVCRMQSGSTNQFTEENITDNNIDRDDVKTPEACLNSLILEIMWVLYNPWDPKTLVAI